MEVDRQISLEEALTKTESDAIEALKAATAAVNSLKKFRTTAQVGNLRELRRTIEAAEQAIDTLREQLVKAKEGWDFNEEAYLSDGSFVSEILATAQQIGVSIYEQDDRLYCYPSLIRVMPNDRIVVIDRAKEGRLRPSVLVSHLKDLQNRPVRFKSGAFLESLYAAYTTAVEARGRGLVPTGTQIALIEIYELLTLLPGQSKEYSREEFARDLYLLDQSGMTTTRKGWVATLHGPRGNESARKIFSIITKDGDVKRYYGVSFAQER